MNDSNTDGRLTAGDRLTLKLLRYAPWVAFFAISLPAPLFFLRQYFAATNEEMGVWMLIVLSSLAISSVFALFVVLMLVLYRRRWEKNLRERLAADGITADELVWFEKELSPAERRALKAMDAQNPLLADAYRETLAARLTAVRVMSSAGRELADVESRLRQLDAPQSGDQQTGGQRQPLAASLDADRTRLQRITREAEQHKSEIETRLQMIEATARRELSEAETARALQRLDITSSHTPYALEATRSEQEAREEIEQLLRDNRKTAARQQTEGEKGQG